MDIQVQQTELGPFLSNVFGDTYLYEINRNTFKNEGSDSLYKNHFEGNFLKPDQLNLFVGTDSGLLLDYLQRQILPKGSRYVFVEIPMVIDRLKSSGKLASLPDQIVVLPYEELWGRKEEFQFENYIYMGKVFFFEAFCTLEGYMQIYREQAFSIKVELDHMIWNIASNIGKAPFIDCQFRNLCEFQNYAATFKNCFKGKTAILLGGGPSLDSILPWLLDNSEKVVILAVSRISKQLWEAKVYPDFIFSVDPQDLSYEVSKEMLHFWKRSIFIYSYHVSPLLLGQWSGRSIMLGALFPWKTPLNKIIFDTSGPTVTNAALQTAVHMGFSQVILGGVDFCYNQKGFTHASGCVESTSGPLLGNTITLTTNDERMAETSPGYFNAMKIMNEQASYAVQQGCRIINPSGQSARLENVDYEALETIELNPPNINYVEELSALFIRDDSKRRVHHYEAVAKELHRVDMRMVKIRNLVKEALKCNDGLFGRKGMKADFKYKLKMDRIEKQLERDFDELYPLIKRNGAHKFLRIARIGSEDEWSDKDVERIGRNYYQACLGSVENLKESIKKAIIRVEMRLEEEQDRPNFYKLGEYWRKEMNLGRGRVWKYKNPEKWTKLNDAERNILLKINCEFEKKSPKAEDYQIKKDRDKIGLHGVSSGALKYFKTGDQDGLKRLQEGLENHPDKEKSEVLVLFVAGLQQELKGRPEKAIDKYYELIGETPNFLTEDVLLRILMISLESMDLDNAKDAAECLSVLSVTYLPYYAKTLHILNDTVGALDVYADYLEKVGNDVAVMLKLGRLYLELGIVEGARLMFESVLEQDAENQTAQHLLLALDEEKI